MVLNDYKLSKERLIEVNKDKIETNKMFIIQTKMRIELDTERLKCMEIENKELEEEINQLLKEVE